MQRSTIVCVSPSDFIFAELILWKETILVLQQNSQKIIQHSTRKNYMIRVCD